MFILNILVWLEHLVLAKDLLFTWKKRGTHTSCANQFSISIYQISNCASDRFFYLTRTLRWMKNCLLLSRGYMPTPFTSQSTFDSIDFNWIWLNHSHFSLVITQLWKMGSSSDVTQTTFNSIQLCSFLFNYQLFFFAFVYFSVFFFEREKVMGFFVRKIYFRLKWIIFDRK